MREHRRDGIKKINNNQNRIDRGNEISGKSTMNIPPPKESFVIEGKAAII
jgi:hypothetical protein